MRHIILSFFFILIAKLGFGQFKLPEAGTTQKQATIDLYEGVTNEMWFMRKESDGYASYCKFFKSTPIGIKHAMKEFAKLKKEMIIKSCTSENTISPSVIIGKEIDYDLLALSIKAESSEIKERCSVNDTFVTSIALHTIYNSRPCLYLVVSTKIKIENE